MKDKTCFEIKRICNFLTPKIIRMLFLLMTTAFFYWKMSALINMKLSNMKMQSRNGPIKLK